ncbi:MAG: cell division protein FtsL [Gammaproteobacteria bacterium]|nr:cell division protein FtsL [Rhodocyclaceae bacterium]MBU3910550.1 cell division protein FtsL [Gammaproteobacteria bacterium]MBU3988193.1 cell division protein FtsL [Gammaproteobacteria bacterium]MBU4005031.1 cell division protein FtsL [Gammaproteobacteria bacterium]MBU4020624.1 cell division protein FtsL [Gammaproteobacteria bacterium]
MLRLNLILLAAVLISALADVSINHRARKLVTSYEREQERMRALEVEWGQLQLEQSTWATHARIEEIARQRLGMHTPRTNQIITANP